MCSEDLECGICYEPYHAAQRCPRELHCKHSFCESCLVALCLDHDFIACPLCRQITHVPGGVARVRAALRVDECVLERMMSAGVLLDDDITADHDTDNSGELHDETPVGASCLEESGDSPSGSRAGRFRQSLRKMWRKILGSKPHGDRERNCVTDEEFRDFAMMSFYTF